MWANHNPGRRAVRGAIKALAVAVVGGSAVVPAARMQAQVPVQPGKTAAGAPTVAVPAPARAVLPSGVSPAGKPSLVWGQDGELWSPQSRLPDFSRAGYRGGAPIPDVPGPIVPAERFGVKADGTTDDSGALQKAVDEMAPGVLLLPAGRILLGNAVTITRPGIVIRGAGPNQTILLAPKSLGEITGATLRADNKFPYSFNGGFLTVRGKDNGTLLTPVAAAAERGANSLQVQSSAGIAVGRWVRLAMEDTDHSLGWALHGGLSDAGEDTYKSLTNRKWIDWAARVVEVKGNAVTLDRPLRLPVKPEWKPALWAMEPTVQEVGIENLAFEFPGVTKKAHLQEEGFNAIDFGGAVNCWVRNVRIAEADNGILVKGVSRFCTISNVTFSARLRTGFTGHHALWASGAAQDNLFTDFNVATIYVHDLTVEGRANGNVFRAGRGEALNLDHHRNAPYENLFTNLDMGNSRRTWLSSGRTDRGPHSAVRATFWNLKATNPFLPAPNFPEINVVGVNVPAKAPNATALVEPEPDPLVPDLYLAQRELRARKTAP